MAPAGRQLLRQQLSSGEGWLPSTLQWLRLLLLLLAWVTFNFAYGTSTKQWLKATPGPAAFLTMQLLLFGMAAGAAGALLAAAGQLGNEAARPAALRRAMQQLLDSRGRVATAGACHLLGTGATCLLFTYGSLALVQVLKSVAPLMTAVWALLLTGRGLSTAAVACLGGAFAGAALASWKEPTFTPAVAATAALAMLALTLRNTLTKGLLTASAAGGGGGGGSALVSVLQLTLVLNGAAFVMTAGVMGAVLPGAGYLRLGHSPWLSRYYPEMALWFGTRRAAELHLIGIYKTVYELASMAVLSYINVISHSMVDMVKRLLVIVASLVVLNDTQWQWHNFLGAVLCAAAIYGYSLVRMREAGSKEVKVQQGSGAQVQQGSGAQERPPTEFSVATLWVSLAVAAFAAIFVVTHLAAVAHICDSGAQLPPSLVGAALQEPLSCAAGVCLDPGHVFAPAAAAAAGARPSRFGTALHGSNITEAGTGKNQSFAAAEANVAPVAACCIAGGAARQLVGLYLGRAGPGGAREGLDTQVLLALMREAALDLFGHNLDVRFTSEVSLANDSAVDFGVLGGGSTLVPELLSQVAQPSMLLLPWLMLGAGQAAPKHARAHDQHTHASEVLIAALKLPWHGGLRGWLGQDQLAALGAPTLPVVYDAAVLAGRARLWQAALSSNQQGASVSKGNHEQVVVAVDQCDEQQTAASEDVWDSWVQVLSQLAHSLMDLGYLVVIARFKAQHTVPQNFLDRVSDAIPGAVVAEPRSVDAALQLLQQAAFGLTASPDVAALVVAAGTPLVVIGGCFDLRDFADSMVLGSDVISVGYQSTANSTISLGLMASTAHAKFSEVQGTLALRKALLQLHVREAGRVHLQSARAFLLQLVRRSPRFFEAVQCSGELVLNWQPLDRASELAQYLTAHFILSHAAVPACL